MTNNFRFCNEEFLPYFCTTAYRFYNQFLVEEETRALLDSIGEHPECRIVFKYDPEKKVRATFILFDGELAEVDVKCICTLFHGDRFEDRCYFYEVYEDGTIGCVQVADGFDEERRVLAIDVGEDVDAYFYSLCASFDAPKTDAVAMLFYNETDDSFRLLDIEPSELADRCLPLLGGDPQVETRECGGARFLFYRSPEDGSFLVAETVNGEDPTDVRLEDLAVIPKAR